MNRRELLGCCAAAILAGCRPSRNAAPGGRGSGLTSIDGYLATVRGECHPLDRHAAAALLAPTRDLHQSLLATFDPPDTTFYRVELLCDASRRLAAVESAAATRPEHTPDAWRRHRDRMTRLRDHLQGLVGRDNVTSIDVNLPAYEAALAGARAARQGDVRRWALADAHWLARDLQSGLRQRAEADEPLHPRFVESHCMTSWRLLDPELAATTDTSSQAEAITEHVARLSWLGDSWLGGILDADLSLQTSVVAYHMRLGRTPRWRSACPPERWPRGTRTGRWASQSTRRAGASWPT